MRTKNVSQDVEKKIEEFNDWYHSVDYITIPIKNMLDSNERKTRYRMNKRNKCK